MSRRCRTLILPQKLWVLVDRIETGQTPPARVHDSLETAFNRGAGRLALLEDDTGHESAARTSVR